MLLQKALTFKVNLQFKKIYYLPETDIPKSMRSSSKMAIFITCLAHTQKHVKFHSVAHFEYRQSCTIKWGRQIQ